MFHNDSDSNLKKMGARLRTERLRRNETQAIFAGRIGVSVPTLRKMEEGNSSVLIGYWAVALEVLDRSGDLDALLACPQDLFAKYDQITKPLPRRASRRTQ